MAATASEPIRLGTRPAAWNPVATPEEEVRRDAVVGRTRAVVLSGRARAVGRDHDVDVTSPPVSWNRVMDGVTLLAVVWSIPIAVLAVGTPIALTIAFVLWLVRLALNAF
jgi:hypothetical protein